MIMVNLAPSRFYPNFFFPVPKQFRVDCPAVSQEMLDYRSCLDNRCYGWLMLPPP